MALIKDNPITLKLSTDLDLTGVISVSIGWEKPDGTVGAWVAAVDGDPTLGLIVYFITDELDASGVWDFWSIADFNGDVYKGAPVKAVVLETPPEEDMIVDVAKVKKYLGITADTYDEKIKLLIPLVQADYERIRGCEFDKTYNSTTGAVTGYSFPSGSDITAAEMIAFKIKSSSLDDITPLQSERIGSYSYTRAGLDSSSSISGYPRTIVGGIKRYMHFGDDYVGSSVYPLGFFECYQSIIGDFSGY